MWQPKEIRLQAREWGFHLVTEERMRQDFESVFHCLVPQDEPSSLHTPYYRHNDAGNDDLPAHIKSCLLGRNQLLPIRQGALALGIW